MDNFKVIPASVKAVANPFNSPQQFMDSRGNTHEVPATWWLVEFPTGHVATMPNETFTAQYERPVAPVPYEDFANIVQDLRGADRMAVQRAVELEARITSLEGLLSPGGQFNPEGVTGAIRQLRTALAEERTETNTRLSELEAWASAASSLSARLGAVEALVNTVKGALAP